MLLLFFVEILINVGDRLVSELLNCVAFVVLARVVRKPYNSVLLRNARFLYGNLKYFVFIE